MYLAREEAEPPRIHIVECRRFFSDPVATARPAVSFFAMQRRPPSYGGRKASTDPAPLVSADAAGGVGLRLDKDEW
jgi:hypothetical protein